MIFNIPRGEQLTLILGETKSRNLSEVRHPKEMQKNERQYFFSFNNASEHWLVSAAALRSHCAPCCRESKSLAFNCQGKELGILMRKGAFKNARDK